MEFVTVTFDRDFHQQILQSMSMDKFILDNCIHYIIIEKTSKTLEEWHASLDPYYQRHKLVLIDNISSEMCSGDINGYYRQQVIKLTISKIIQGDTYIILDSKDIFIKPFNTRNWPIIDGNQYLYSKIDNKWTEGSLSSWNGWMDHVERWTNLPKPEWFWIPVTPFRINKHNINKMLDLIDINKLFLTAEITPDSASEFILYRYFSDCIPAKVGISKFVDNTKYYEICDTLSLRNTFDEYFIHRVVMAIDLKSRINLSIHRFYIANFPKDIDIIKLKLYKDVGLDKELVNKAFDVDYWIANR